LATNHLGRIDEAILRPGRFDFMIEISHPKRDRIEEYLQGALTQKTCEMLGNGPDDPAKREPKNQTQLRNFTKPVLDAVKDQFEKEEKVRFAWVEEALRAVAQETGAKNNRKQAAAKSLKRNRTGTERSQPPPLSERSEP